MSRRWPTSLPLLLLAALFSIACGTDVPPPQDPDSVSERERGGQDGEGDEQGDGESPTTDSATDPSGDPCAEVMDCCVVDNGRDICDNLPELDLSDELCAALLEFQHRCGFCGSESVDDDCPLQGPFDASDDG